jgi:hypothetical protein
MSFAPPFTPSVRIAAFERTTSITAPYNIKEAIDHFHTFGFVILEDVIELDVLEKLSAKMQGDAGIKRNDPNLVFNQGVLQTNFSMPPPLEKEFLFESVWANKHAVAVSKSMYSSDTGKSVLVGDTSRS